MNDIIEYHHPQFTGKTIFCHKDFAPYLDKMGEHAKGLGLVIIITDCFNPADVVKGAIVPRAGRSNHKIGFAIDCNIQNGKVIWNSEALENPDTTIRSFIQLCKADGMRWGGEFKNIDTVHFDVPINITNPAKWDSIFNSIHKTT